jgi:hypothetical protein
MFQGQLIDLFQGQLIGGEAGLKNAFSAFSFFSVGDDVRRLEGNRRVMGSEPGRGVLPRGDWPQKQPFTRILFFFLLLGSPLRTPSQHH